MPKDLIFRIGAIGFGLIGNKGWKYTGQNRIKNFLSNETPQIRFNVRINPIPTEPSNPPVFETGLLWRIYQENNHWIIWIHTERRNPYLVGNFTSDFNSGEIFITESEDEKGKFIFPISYPLGELLMMNLLATGYGIMLHSCGVIDREDGIVFAGTSSAGKTTTFRLWDNVNDTRVLNDDHIIIRNVNGQFRVFSTPWHGQGGKAQAGDAPLKKIFILKHASFNRAVRLSPVHAAVGLLVRTFAPYWNTRAMEFTLKFLDELCQTIPCYELGFVPDRSAVEYVRGLP